MFSAQLLIFGALVGVPPTPAQVKSVLDYYFSGTEPILAEALLCKSIEKEDDETKWDCKERYGAKATKGDKVYVHLTFLVPKDQSKDLMLQAAHDGVVRTTKDITVKGTYFRHRLFRAFSLEKAGRWDFHIRDGEKILKTLSIQVSE